MRASLLAVWNVRSKGQQGNGSKSRQHVLQLPPRAVITPAWLAVFSLHAQAHTCLHVMNRSSDVSIAFHCCRRLPTTAIRILCARHSHTLSTPLLCLSPGKMLTLHDEILKDLSALSASSLSGQLDLTVSWPRTAENACLFHSRAVCAAQAGAQLKLELYIWRIMTTCIMSINSFAVLHELQMNKYRELMHV